MAVGINRRPVLSRLLRRETRRARAADSSNETRWSKPGGRDMVSAKCDLLCTNTRLSRDRECLPETSEIWIYIAMIRIMVRRLA